MNKNLVLAGLDEEEKAAIAKDRDTGRWRPHQPPPIRSVGPRLKPQFFGTAQHFRHADIIAETVTNLLDRGDDAVEPQQYH